MVQTHNAERRAAMDAKRKAADTSQAAAPTESTSAKRAAAATENEDTGKPSKKSKHDTGQRLQHITKKVSSLQIPVAPAPRSKPTPTPAPRSSRWKRATIAQTHPFFKLPGELTDDILSYLPSFRVSAARRCCQQLHGLVVSFEKQDAPPRIAFYRKRLQTIIDDINNARMPTDAESLLAVLRLWTSKRGSFRLPGASMQSLEKWFSHLAGGQIKSISGQPLALFEIWTDVAMQATQLQLQARDTRDLRGFAYNLQGTELRNEFRRRISGITNYPLSTAEQEKLIDHIINTKVGAERSIMNPFHKVDMDHKTIPSDSLAHHYRLSPIRTRVGTANDPQGMVKNPSLPADILCGGFFDLPGLGTSTFCYYVVKKAWVTRLLKERYGRFPQGKEETCLLKKASMLEWVDIF